MGDGDTARRVVSKVGIWWPAGDESGLRAAADRWRVFASDVELLATDASRAARDLVAGNSGPAVDAFDTFWRRYDGPPDAYLPALATTGRAMGTALDQYADTVRDAKKRIEEMAVTIGASLVVGTALAAFTFGASEAAADGIAAGLVTAAESLSVEVSEAAAQIVATVLADTAVAAAENTLLDIAVAQPVRVLAFHDGGFDLAEAERALASGAEGGAAGSLSRILRIDPVALGIGPGAPGTRCGPQLDLPPRPRWASPHLRDHIFLGHIKPKRITGYHSRPGGVDTGSARVTSTTPVGDTGVYRAVYQQLDENGDPLRNSKGQELLKESTFFPDAWSAKQVEEAIGKSFEKFRLTGRLDAHGGKFEGTVDGIAIEGYYGFDETTGVYEVVTAYPNSRQ